MDWHPQRRIILSRQYVADGVGTEYCDFAFMEPFEACGVEPGHREAGNGRDALGPPKFEAAGPQEHHIAFAQLHAMVAFGGFEVFRIDRVAWLNPIAPADLWNIDQHTAADDAGARNVDGTLVRTLEIDLRRIEAVVQLTAPEMMAEGVQMRSCEPVRFDREIVGAAEGTHRMADLT